MAQHKGIPAVVLPMKFIVFVDKEHYLAIQKALLGLGYRWAMKAPPGKGTEESRADDKPRLGPHHAIDCFIRDGKKLMARVLYRSSVDRIIKKEDKYELFTAKEFLGIVHGTNPVFVGIDPAAPGSDKTVFFDEESNFNWSKDMGNKRKPWSFLSRHAGDIDFVKIAADLSYAKPIALVRPTDAKVGTQVWLVLHYKLLLKAQLIKEQVKGLFDEPRFAVKDLTDCYSRGFPTRDGVATVVRMNLEETGGIIKAAKLVKLLPWPTGDDKRSCRIEVTTPEV